MKQLTLLRDTMSKYDLDAVYLTAPSESVCFAGCSTAGSTVVVTQETVYAIAPEGSDIASWATLRPYGVYGFAQVERPGLNEAGILEELLSSVSRIGVSSDKLPRAALPTSIKALRIDITEDINAAMDQKPEDFLPRFLRALNLNAAAYRAVANNLHAGQTELDLYETVISAYWAEAGGPVNYTGDFISGARCADISGAPTKKLIETGDTVITDTLVEYEGAFVDTTRTFFVGPPSISAAKAYHAVARALRAAEQTLRPGITACAVYHAVCASLEADGYPALPHHAGHGVGYSWYERPYFIPACDQQLKPGMLVTLEPGVYTSEFGIRIENNYRLTPDGCENLLDFPIDLDYVIR